MSSEINELEVLKAGKAKGNNYPGVCQAGNQLTKRDCLVRAGRLPDHSDGTIGVSYNHGGVGQGALPKLHGSRIARQQFRLHVADLDRHNNGPPNYNYGGFTKNSSNFLKIVRGHQNVTHE